MKNKPRVFISYVREDFEIARKLSHDLRNAGVNTWLDEENILPGQNRKIEIRQAVKECSYFLILISQHSASDRGFFQKEQKIAFDILDEIPEGNIFIIPVRIDNVAPINERLMDIHHVDLFSSYYSQGLEKILRVVTPEARSFIEPHAKRGVSRSFIESHAKREVSKSSLNQKMIFLIVIFLLFPSLLFYYSVNYNLNYIQLSEVTAIFWILCICTGIIILLFKKLLIYCFNIYKNISNKYNHIREIKAQLETQENDIIKRLKEANNITLLSLQINELAVLYRKQKDKFQNSLEIFPMLHSISKMLEEVTSLSDDDPHRIRLILRDALTNLDTLNTQIEIIGSQTKERWKPVIEQCCKIISDELQKIVPSSEEIEETENPYQTGNPLQFIRKNLFKGRKNLTETIVHSLLERHRPTLVLHGPRRMGKTSFLLQLPALLPGNTIPIFADLQRPAFVQDTASFLYSLARAISSDARPYRIIIPSPERQFFEKSPFSAFEDWLDKEALPKLQTFNILLTFDEFENLGKAIEKEKISTDILDELRHLIQHQTQMAFLFAGVKTMEDLGQNWSSYFINIKPVPMSYLLPDEVHELIVNPDKNANFTLKYHEEVITRIIEMTKCHPYLVQLVCSAVVEEANLAKNNYADSEILEKAVNRALQQGEPYFRNIWDEMAGTDGQEILRQIALSETPLNFPDTDTKIQKALAQMVKLKVLTKTDGKYCVEVPLVKQWITELAPVK